MKNVLLMVDRGDGTAVCAGEASADRKRNGISLGSEPDSARDWWVTYPAKRAQESAARWWLVEAECAQAARDTIRMAEIEDSCAPGSLPRHFVGPGRILAWGPKS